MELSKEKLKNKDPELFEAFMKGPLLAGYLGGFLQALYNRTPDFLVDEYRKAMEAEPNLSRIEAIAAYMRNTLLDYSEQNWQNNGVSYKWKSTINLVDDIFKEMAGYDYSDKEAKESIDLLLDGTYLGVH